MRPLARERCCRGGPGELAMKRAPPRLAWLQRARVCSCTGAAPRVAQQMARLHPASSLSLAA
eukprot:1053437-Rhodomonas_salina.1